jgi:DNA modification methylase
MGNRGRKAQRTGTPIETRGIQPAMAPESWPLAQIHPYPENPRVHPQEQINLLARLLAKYGIDQPIVCDEGGVILKGHGRRLAALQAGLTEFPVVVRRGLSEDDKRAMRIQDNQAALLSEWSQQLIKRELAHLKLAGFDMPLLGFGDRQLATWGIGTGIPEFKDPDEIPTEPKRPIVKLGEVWLLGQHRLAIGDATSASTWKALFGRDRAAMVFTDPPYGVSYAARSGKFDVIKCDEKRRDELYTMLVKALRETARYTVDRGALYIWHASSTREDFAQAMKAVGISERQYLIWVKPAIVLGWGDYRWAHEPCFYAAKGDQAPAFYGERDASTVWHVQLARPKETSTTVGSGVVLLDGHGAELYVQMRPPKNKKARQIRIQQGQMVLLAGAERDTTIWEVARDRSPEHPTQKPVELARRAIENSSQPGEIIADGFLGSGTTLIAAEMTGRRCYGIELDPIYAEVTIRRWEKFAGAAAVCEASGQTFAETTKRRTRTARSNDMPPAAGRGARDQSPAASPD